MRSIPSARRHTLNLSAAVEGRAVEITLRWILGRGDVIDVAVVLIEALDAYHVELARRQTSQFASKIAD